MQGTDCHKRILRVGNDLHAWPLGSARKSMEAQIELARPDQRGDGIGTESSNPDPHLWIGRAESLEKKRQLKIRTETLQNAQMQPTANDAVLRADCRDSGLECRERGTGVLQEQSSCLGQATLRVVRSTSRDPSSSSLMDAESPYCTMCIRCAARVKLPSSERATKC
jgi:hypothetical protein